MNRFNFHSAPYNALNASQRQTLEKATDIVFFDDHATIIQTGDQIDTLYVIIKGLVKEVDTDGEVLALYHPEDSFDTRALFENKHHHSFVAAEQSLLYAIPKSIIRQLINDNNEFGAFFFANIADKLKEQTGGKKEHELASLFTAKVSDAYRPCGVLLSGDATLADAARLMQEQKTKSLLLSHQEQIGLIAESVFRNVMMSDVPVDPNQPAYLWARFELISVDVNDFMFSALLKMMNHRIQRVVVTQNNHPIGLLEQIDILAFLSNHSHLIAERLEVATTLDELTTVSHQMTDSIQGLFASGMQAKQLSQLMQVLNARLFEKAWQMIAPPEIFANSCLLVMGSEGRGEQILKTDQDNALIVQDGIDIDSVRPYADKLSATLERFGYPPCDGKIMVNNPAWCQNVSDFKKTVARWCRNANPENMMNLAIFIDAKAVAGDETLLQEVKQHLKDHRQNDVGMLMNFARAIQLFDEDGRGFFAQILGQKRRKMDIKKMGIFPVVHGVRALSFQAGINETNTLERIQTLSQMGILEKQLSQDVSEALVYLMNLRLKSRLFAIKHQQDSLSNQIAIENLSTLERDLLKDALQVVKRFKHAIKTHFHLQN